MHLLQLQWEEINLKYIKSLEKKVLLVKFKLSKKQKFKGR